MITPDILLARAVVNGQFSAVRTVLANKPNICLDTVDQARFP